MTLASSWWILVASVASFSSTGVGTKEARWARWAAWEARFEDGYTGGNGLTDKLQRDDRVPFEEMGEIKLGATSPVELVYPPPEHVSSRARARALACDCVPCVARRSQTASASIQARKHRQVFALHKEPIRLEYKERPALTRIL
jgi:hypothetical protein